MDSNIIVKVLKGMESIGNQIDKWRFEESARKINEPKEFKTEADIRANLLIKKLIFSVDETAEIISEEDCCFNLERPNSYWLLDPIDGTASWYDGYDGFVTQIAYIKDSIPVFGVICAPVLKKVWWGIRGQGAFLNGKQLNKRNKNLADTGLTLIDNYSTPRNIAQEIYKLKNVSSYIESGSLGLKCVLVADGTADIFVKDVIVRDWDLAPAYVILQEVGSQMSDLSGKCIPFNGDREKRNGLLVSANIVVNDLVVEFIKKKKLNI